LDIESVSEVCRREARLKGLRAGDVLPCSTHKRRRTKPRAVAVAANADCPELAIPGDYDLAGALERDRKTTGRARVGAERAG
jgi:hypothetical protein